jgi:hypothetical protein
MTATHRKRRATSSSRRKDRVLHARIPEQLDEELRDRAGRLGLSVSTIVRNVLLHTFDLVGDIVSDSAQIAYNLGYPRTGAAGPKPESDPIRSPVLAWQPGSLNVNAVCDQCNALLPKGSRAGIGVPAGERPVFLCLDCLQRLEIQGTEPQPAVSDK